MKIGDRVKVISVVAPGADGRMWSEDILGTEGVVTDMKKIANPYEDEPVLVLLDDHTLLKGHAVHNGFYEEMLEVI